MRIKRRGRPAYGEGTFGNWLESKLLETDMLATDVAEGLGICPETVSRHLHLRVKPTFTTVVAYCWFFGGQDNPLQVWRFVQRDWG